MFEFWSGILKNRMEVGVWVVARGQNVDRPFQCPDRSSLRCPVSGEWITEGA